MASQELREALRCEHSSDQTDTSVSFLTNRSMRIMSAMISWA